MEATHHLNRDDNTCVPQIIGDELSPIQKEIELRVKKRGEIILSKSCQGVKCLKEVYKQVAVSEVPK